MRTLRSSLAPAIAVLASLVIGGPVSADTDKITDRQDHRAAAAFTFRPTSRWTRASSRPKASTLPSSTLTGRALVTAGLSGSIDFVPIPSGGAQAALSGAEIRYVVGESLQSQWVIVARAEHQQGRGPARARRSATAAPAPPTTTKAQAVMQRAFKMEVGKDYKVISFQGEPERIAALINGDIQGALISVPHAPKALNAGMKILVRTGDYIQRAGGTIWTREGLRRAKSRRGQEVHPRHRQRR